MKFLWTGFILVFEIAAIKFIRDFYRAKSIFQKIFIILLCYAPILPLGDIAIYCGSNLMFVMYRMCEKIDYFSNETDYWQILIRAVSFQGPALFKWYGFLDKLLPGSGGAKAIKMVVVDQVGFELLWFLRKIKVNISWFFLTNSGHTQILESVLAICGSKISF